MFDPDSVEVSTWRSPGSYAWSDRNQYVSVVHKPTALGVVVGTERSQYANKEKALKLLEQLVQLESQAFAQSLPYWQPPTPVANKVMMIKEVREKTGVGLKEAKEAVDLTGSVEGAMIYLTGSTGYCSEGGACVCGRDLLQIREGCYNWQR